jgi:hypothetical protein
LRQQPAAGGAEADDHREAAAPAVGDVAHVAHVLAQLADLAPVALDLAAQALDLRLQPDDQPRGLGVAGSNPAAPTNSSAG